MGPVYRPISTGGRSPAEGSPGRKRSRTHAHQTETELLIRPSLQKTLPSVMWGRGGLFGRPFLPFPVEIPPPRGRGLNSTGVPRCRNDDAYGAGLKNRYRIRGKALFKRH